MGRESKRTRENRYEKDRHVSRFSESRISNRVRERARVQGALSSTLLNRKPNEGLFSRAPTPRPRHRRAPTTTCIQPYVLARLYAKYHLPYRGVLCRLGPGDSHEVPFARSLAETTLQTSHAERRLLRTKFYLAQQRDAFAHSGSLAPTSEIFFARVREIEKRVKHDTRR